MLPFSPGNVLLVPGQSRDQVTRMGVFSTHMGSVPRPFKINPGHVAVT